ncbi:unnamed protein product [Adineta steineri]|uniref:Uncharacterized protein n=1 Tax=Adineta steineri TaxID=433720 RepID=A0A815F3G4_9BILA|nr:unnamed protein product [Adineta steineri]CAF3711491.1 unnamed protein product [Adineta steineri]
MIVISLYCFLLLLLHRILIIKSIVLQYETKCKSSRFIDLENLIGSLHTYAPNSTKLIVRDMGLTNGHQDLLKRYENIQIVSSNYAQSSNIQQIDVDHEFILINNTLYSRNNQGKYPFIDLIRKQFSFALVIPFIESQLNNLIHLLNLTEIYLPCQKYFHSTDLIFYHNEESSSVLEKNITKLNYQNKCFKNIYYFAANLSADEDMYPVGSAYMWKKLFSNESTNTISLRARGYTHFFLMEPDTRPIRSYWLDAIIEKITNRYDQQSYISTNWWMIGSIYRGTIPLGREFLHINGNALYHLSLDFIRFIENVSNEIPNVLGKTNGYDLDLFLYMFKHVDIAKNVWHKFQFTDLIQNCWHSGCNDTDSDFTHMNPDTYLVHGNKILPKAIYSLKKFFYFILLGLCLMFCLRFRHYCRRVFINAILLKIF